ncbi:MAG: metal-dependent transcriptional regulator [Alicyclobacillaceae bacterium]|jgi:DtxR family Mn-dependent transcriptional regulator|uniref:metal-dependent transcriptional regulator n=1 Tax=Alicyclobacillus sp. SP_1 TaxID=2942475 RepID=UPI0021585D1D|nr:metal-dependent transcriptional regulator [Alicyclobacillus sp. SP_1]MCY0888391.1 metal-dependent transcriptional regulator [Alicyclobacillaceae bacterium]MCY0895458.1 metal-dependent transcriptional regulator [Alicyclobacillaceae bacterium]
MTRTHGMDAYLEAIYVLEAEGESVLSSKVADYLEVSRPTVTQTMQRLTAAGLVEVGDSKEILLTEDGRMKAESLVRRHRLLERWLTDELGLDWADAHVEAGRLEHSISPLVERQLFERLGHPTTCPHGNVIPGTGFRQPNGIPLSHLRPGDEAKVVRIVELAEEDLDLLRYFHKSGIVPSATLTVQAPQSAYDPSVTVLVVQDSRALPVSLSPDVAKRVLVERVVKDGVNEHCAT